jgi:hypothetical protein
VSTQNVVRVDDADCKMWRSTSKVRERSSTLWKLFKKMFKMGIWNDKEVSLIN